MFNESLLLKLKKANIVVKKNVKLRAGESADYYIDVKKVYGDPKLLHNLGLEISETLDPSTTCLAVSGYGGIPLGVMVSQVTELPLSLIRGDEKDHGKGGMIDSYNPTKKDKVSVLDDVFTTGSSLTETIKVLAEENINVVGCNVVVTRGDISAFPYKVSYLFKSEDLV